MNRKRHRMNRKCHRMNRKRHKTGVYKHINVTCALKTLLWYCTYIIGCMLIVWIFWRKDDIFRSCKWMKMFFPTHTTLCYKMARFTTRRLLLSEIASSMCSLSSNFLIAQQFLLCFGRACDADVTLILFIRPHFVTFICLYAHNGKGSISCAHWPIYNNILYVSPYSLYTI